MKNPQDQNLESVWDLQAGGPSQDLSLLTYLLILFIYHDVYNEEKQTGSRQNFVAHVYKT